jgi:ribosomal protein L22
VSFKNTRETAQAINGWKLQRAVTFLENVKEHKEAVPMRRYAGSTGRTAQGTTRQILPQLAMDLEKLGDLKWSGYIRQRNNNADGLNQ